VDGVKVVAGRTVVEVRQYSDRQWLGKPLQSGWENHRKIQDKYGKSQSQMQVYKLMFIAGKIN